jgi:hypothetical protein
MAEPEKEDFYFGAGCGLAFLGLAIFVLALAKACVMISPH